METVKSPITHGEVTLIKVISTFSIINEYRDILGIDVSEYFDSLDEIRIYECNDTNYRFYYPLNIEGDGSFYAKLQEFDWYYMPWKWEYQEAAKKVKSGMKVLEIGSAKGDFLSKIQSDYNGIVTGLELNKKAVEEANKQGVNTFCESVQAHAKAHAGVYDLVCSFQVLEHVSDVRAFLEAMVKCLKPNGHLIIGVPNNLGFLRLDMENPTPMPLNAPPHHVGLWDEVSLRNISKLFSLKVDSVKFEPLADYHSQLHKDLYISHFKEMVKKPSISKWISRLPTALSWRAFHYGPAMYYRWLCRQKRGQGILVSYKKV